MKSNPTLEIKFDAPEAFALAVQHTIDGDRIAAQKRQSEADQKIAARNQTEFGATMLT